MIQVKNLHLMHKKDLRPILENFSFALNPGDKAVVIGEEGNGKSTLLKWLVNPALGGRLCGSGGRAHHGRRQNRISASGAARGGKRADAL